MLVIKLILTCLAITSAEASVFKTPTVLVSKAIHFEDDLDFSSLDLAIERQLQAYDGNFPLTGKVQFGNSIYSANVLKESLVIFNKITEAAKNCIKTRSRTQCIKDFNSEVNARFKIYRPTLKTSKFTAYYSPDFYGSLTETSRFHLPLYRVPSDPSLQSSTREQIVFDRVLSGQGLESVYLDADLYQLYDLQIEGGGRVHLIDSNGNETIQYISFEGKNGLPLVFFSKLFVQNGYLTSSELSFENMRNYFLNHPEIQRKMYSQSPSYVYFKLSSTEPEGIHNIPLTENRSLAFDRSYYPFSGLLNFIQTHTDQGPIQRFFLSQDTGSAIKGVARADLYFGFGEQARIQASSLQEQGTQYFLIRK